ncbi:MULTISPECIES: carboxymuconolactone decarboxylase family protein [Bacillus]|uniref:carboxymuconolactone decarboxylase family protein n=1 Tax=Bacillus TaxID=1386 RepID=UPI0003F7FC96|nr:MULTISPECIES: carboxymuconolactone decarboxylase family protein [Bacillus]QHZ47821.1 carboxymuconolactone decarboxylase family protein [Bacillus sp. NSP9.1]WFA03900.1 carboxymuconolactone decarboxylase family protein [Bacillus sp. HSf4]
MQMCDNYKKGLKVLEQIDQDHYEEIVNSFKESIAPDLGKLAVEFNYGQIFSRPGLELKSRLLASVAGLTALGNTEQLPFYINGALNAGWTKEEIIEVMMQMIIYSGFPNGLNTILTVASEVFAERNGDPEESHSSQ